MPLALFIIGAALIVSAFRGTEGQLGTLVLNDLSGGFLKWLIALFIIGLLGYVPGIQTPSRFLLALVLLVLFIGNGQGFFAQLNQQFTNPQKINAPPDTQITQNPTVNVQGAGGGGSGSGGILGSITGAIGGGIGKAISSILPF